jgi:peptidoglycan hydrolase-like protein with peptidoglycan-binding domain
VSRTIDAKRTGSRHLDSTGTEDSRRPARLQRRADEGRARRAAVPGAATVVTTTPFTRLAATVLARGARGLAVQTLQRALGGLAVDGVFGPRTEAAARSFQEAAGLRATGIVEEATWLALEAKEYPFLRYRSTVLRRGSCGPAVAALQAALHLPGDGIFGPATEEAVAEFQERRRLATTGLVGARTWEALDAEARGRG